MKIWLITVNFGNSNPTRELIESLSVCKNLYMIKVGIADNASSNQSFGKLKEIKNEKKIDIKIFKNQKNLYYWPAAKKILYKMKKINGTFPDWVIICNNDIVFPDKDFLEKLKAINKQKCPILGPDIIDNSGTKSNPFLETNPSLFSNLYWKLYYSSYPLSICLSITKKWIGKLLIKSKKNGQDDKRQVYAIHGSAVFLSNYFFEKGGWLDDNFELFGEEITLAEIAKKIKVPITYVPELKIVHNEHSTTKTLDKKTLFMKGKESFDYIKSNF